MGWSISSVYSIADTFFNESNTRKKVIGVMTNVNRSNTICSNCINTNYYGDNGGVRDGNLLCSRSEW